MKTNFSLLYQLEKNQIIKEMIYCMEHVKSTEKEVEERFQKVIANLIYHGCQMGYHGNLWHCYLAEQIVMDENPYALACEKKGVVNGTINIAALADIKMIFAYFTFDVKRFLHLCAEDTLEILCNFDKQDQETRIQNGSFLQAIEELAHLMQKTSSAEEMKVVVTKFYKEIGVGNFGLYKAFRMNDYENSNISLIPIQDIEAVHLDDLVGYETAKNKLIANTEAFIHGRPANNCLLFGDAGTGKSSSIKGILNTYYQDGLRIVEVYKHQFKYLNDLMELLKTRNYKFIIYMDDLSFEDFEIEYKYLKGVIEGGLGSKAENILIYATSNRRHLIRENYADKEEIREDMHTSDTVQEKLSLVARFGVSIFFCRPNRKEFAKIVTTLANRYHIAMQEEELLYLANQWELSHGGLSGRTAKQFIDYIRGENK